MYIQSEEKKDNSGRIEFLQNENRLLREHLERLASKVHAKFEQTLDASLSLPALLDRYRELLSANIRLESQVNSYGDLLRRLFNSSEKAAGNNSSFMQIVKALKPGNLSPVGGKTCTKAVEAHARGGDSELEKLLDLTNGNARLRADVYTTIARQYQKKKPGESAKLAAKALECDPRLYRLKWYAFRLHGAGRVLEAEALLDLLGESVSYNEQEQQRIDQIHDECSSLVQEKLENELSEASSSGSAPYLEFLYGKIKEVASSRLKEQDFLLDYMNNQSAAIQTCSREFWANGLETIREELTTARSKELAFLLDCMDDQKDVIRKSSEDAWLQVMEKIREQIDRLATPQKQSGDKSPETDALKKQLVLLRLDAFAKYGVQTAPLELESAETLEFILLLLNLIKSRNYDLIIELGIGTATTSILELLTSINEQAETSCFHYIFCGEKNKTVLTLRDQYGKDKNMEFCVLPVKKETDEEPDFKCLTSALKNLPLDDKCRMLIVINDAGKPNFPASAAFSAIFPPTLEASHDFILPPRKEGGSEKGLFRNWKDTAITLGQSGRIENYACGAERLSLAPHK